MSSRSVVSRFVAALCFGFVAAVAATAQAQEVIPSEKVTRRVILREAATQRSADVGSFRPGERAELLEAASGIDPTPAIAVSSLAQAEARARPLRTQRCHPNAADQTTEQGSA